MGWSGLVEAQGHLVGEGKEGSGGGVVGAEAVLGGGKGEGIKFREEESFEDFDGGAQEGDGTVSRP